MTSAMPPVDRQPLPCIVQIGFAGSRELFAQPAPDDATAQTWKAAVLEHLVGALRRLRETLRLGPQHHLCGISQIARGGDFVFTEACHTLGTPQRIFLPQPLDDYLMASGSTRTADFSAQERQEVHRLLGLGHIIQQTVVSHANERPDRFRETNAEILRVSDAVVCLIRDDASGREGGSVELLDRARAIGTPALEIRVSVRSGRVVCEDRQHLGAPDSFHPPTLPPSLSGVSLPATHGRLPSSEQYGTALKTFGSAQAKLHRRRFSTAAAQILVTHVLATLLATLALVLHHSPTPPAATSVVARDQPASHGAAPDDQPTSDPLAHPEHHDHGSKGHGLAELSERAIPLLLVAEILLLLAGLKIHDDLHHSEAARVWANARVAAEIARSIHAVHPRHIDLAYLFVLPLPHRLSPLLHTLNVLHLRSTYADRAQPWQRLRDDYRTKRIGDQITFYGGNLALDEIRQKRWLWVFTLFSALAMVATAEKLAVVISASWFGVSIELAPQILGAAAIVLPVLAVAALSWSAALDYEARVETFREALTFLRQQERLLPTATTPAEMDRLILETEGVLLGEVSSWFSRRANTGVA